ncbi:hypothetical protein PILCRDRAFT_290625 [Piloderma croceum F 1598]|uniref:Uncharacterized protein n=1 Tax=Piloderma croceum (strain F 1598) TaxID=765440 RepID=A0A0C3FS53_PILCF|nr:hypothetical protein PILCRDRAFT_290625 [Piloderma croceum F 1598]
MSFASVLACLKPVFNPSSNRRVHWPRRAKFRRNPSSPTRQNSIHDSTYNSLTESRTHEADIVPARSSPTPNTALNVFKFALETLSSASDNIPVPGVKFAIDTLLTITRNIQVRSNAPMHELLIPNYYCIYCSRAQLTQKALMI